MPEILLSRTQIQAVDFLERCAHELEPLAALTGAAGTGKTVALNTALARRESAGDRVIRVNNFVAGPLSLHRVLASSLGVEEASELSAEELEPVLRKALADAGQAEPPVVAVDDAQSLLPETLRYLCLLAGLREAGRPLFRILLVGRPGFTVRQPIPLQFTLESMRPEAAREVVEHGLAAAGVTAEDEVVQDLVRHAQGNLRKLDLLLRDSIQEAQKGSLKPGSRRRVTTQGLQVAANARPRSRRARRPSSAAWLVVPALAAVGAVGVGIAYHDRWFPSHVPAPSHTPVAPARTLSAPPPPAAPSTPPAQAPAAPNSGVASASTLPPVQPVPATAPQQATKQATKQAPRQATEPPPGQAQTSGPGPAAAQPVQPVQPAEPPPVVAAPSKPVRTAPPAPEPSAPVTSPPPPPPQASAQQAASAPDRVATGESGHFRIYNIGACHHGVCPRWSVTDLDRQQRFVAGFDPASLHLDRDTMQRVREGALDLIVTGSVTRNGAEEPTLDASTLESIAPHRGRSHAASSQPEEPADPQATPSPPPMQSPPPGFLSLPADNSPFGTAGSTPYQQGGQY